MMYGKKTNNKLSDLYHFVLWTGYSEEKSTWELSAAIMHLRKLINTFHKKHPEKPITIFSLLNAASLMARPIVPKSHQSKNKAAKLKAPIKEIERERAESFFPS